MQKKNVSDMYVEVQRSDEYVHGISKEEKNGAEAIFEG